jgi:hypothetical protein
MLTKNDCRNIQILRQLDALTKQVDDLMDELAKLEDTETSFSVSDVEGYTASSKGMETVREWLFNEWEQVETYLLQQKK